MLLYANILPRHSLLTTDKSFTRPHPQLDYGAIRGTSTEKIYQELSMESLRDRRWYRQSKFYRVFKNESPITSLLKFWQLTSCIALEILMRYHS